MNKKNSSRSQQKKKKSFHFHFYSFIEHSNISCINIIIFSSLYYFLCTMNEGIVRFLLFNRPESHIIFTKKKEFRCKKRENREE